MIRRIRQQAKCKSCVTQPYKSNYFHLCCVLYDRSNTGSKRQEFLTEKALKLKDFEFTLTD